MSGTNNSRLRAVRRRRKRPRKISTTLPDSISGQGYNSNSKDDDEQLLIVDESEWGLLTVNAVHRPLPLLSGMAETAMVKRTITDVATGRRTVRPMVIPLLANLLRHNNLIEAALSSRRRQEERPSDQKQHGSTTTRPSPWCPWSSILSSSSSSSHATPTLSDAQHARYFGLRDLRRQGLLRFQEDGRNMALRREWKALREAVRVERQRVTEAVDAFRHRHVDRFSVGFAQRRQDDGLRVVTHGPVSDARRYRQRWLLVANGMPLQYGPSGQAVSLRRDAKQHEYHHFIVPDEDEGAPSTTMGIFPSRVVSPRNGAPTTTGLRKIDLTDALASLVGTRLCTNRTTTATATTNNNSCYGSSLLRCDTEARRLAKEHGASTMMTSEAFRTLLEPPGLNSTRWKIPVSVSKDVAVLEDPLPCANTPRESLTRGFAGPLTVALRQYAKDDDGTKNNNNHNQQQHVYTLVDVPGVRISSTTTTKSKPVLVRSTDDLFCHDTGAPIKRMVQLEYFYGHPQQLQDDDDHHHHLALWEQHDDTMRATWILEKMLRPDRRVLVVHVDPHDDGRVLAVAEKGIADALSRPDFSYGRHFCAALPSMVHAVSTSIVEGRHLLCLPGIIVGSGSSNNATTTVSVHPGVDKGGGKGGTIVVTMDVQRELEHAESVFTSKEALVTCFRMWQWDADRYPGRIPYTFPAVPTKEDMVGDGDED